MHVTSNWIAGQHDAITFPIFPFVSLTCMIDCDGFCKPKRKKCKRWAKYASNDVNEFHLLLFSFACVSAVNTKALKGSLRTGHAPWTVAQKKLRVHRNGLSIWRVFRLDSVSWKVVASPTRSAAFVCWLYRRETKCCKVNIEGNQLIKGNFENIFSPYACFVLPQLRHNTKANWDLLLNPRGSMKHDESINHHHYY